jgi:predicted MFS family arabinose efflux permease
MNGKRFKPSPATVAATVGMLALASAMGIGRFSLTPILPLMQHDMGLTIAQGSWLATGNYLGYLTGALICMAFVPRPVPAIRFGLVGVATFTFAMGLSYSLPLWFAFRFSAGVASAFVLVGVSAWAMPILARYNKERWSGRVFAGVGVGIALAGLLALAAGIHAWGSRSSWVALGVVAAVLAVLLWRPLAMEGRPPASPSQARVRMSRRVFVAAACYGVFGYGYIIPATFLPALARGYIDDPVMFGWIWPLFGAAAAISTLVAARPGQRSAPRRLWTRAQWVLAAGVLAPVVSVNMMTLLIAAVCVGGTFMVITMAGITELLRIGARQAARGVGMMTAAFAVGQIAGPLTVSLFAGSSNAFEVPSLIAASALAIGNFVLSAGRRDREGNDDLPCVTDMQKSPSPRDEASC